MALDFSRFGTPAEDDTVVSPEVQRSRDATRLAMLRTEREQLAAEGQADPHLEREIRYAEEGRDFTGRLNAKAAPLDFSKYGALEPPAPPAPAPKAAPPDQEESGALRRYVADPAISLAKGVIGFPEAVVGLADIPTGGRVGKAVEDAGVRFKQARGALDQLLTPEQQAANARVNAADGALDTLTTVAENPSVIPHTIIESVPSTLGGGALARGVRAVIPKASAVLAGATGEGAMSAGQTAEQVRQDTASGTLGADQAAIAAGSGLLTGLLGAAGGRVARRLGIADIDSALAGAGDAAAKKGLVRRVLEGAISEGVLEELPQSAQEQVAQNVATGKPWDQGVSQQAVLGMLAGAGMGAGANVRGHASASPAPAVAATPTSTPEANVVEYQKPDLTAMRANELTTAPGPVAAPAGNEIDFTRPDPLEPARGVEEAVAAETARQAEAARVIPYTPEAVDQVRAGLLELEPAGAKPRAAGNEIDIQPFLQERALMRANGISLADWLGQGDLLGRPFSPETIDLMQRIDALAAADPELARQVQSIVERSNPLKEATTRETAAAPATSPAPDAGNSQPSQEARGESATASAPAEGAAAQAIGEEVSNAAHQGDQQAGGVQQHQGDDGRLQERGREDRQQPAAQQEARAEDRGGRSTSREANERGGTQVAAPDFSAHGVPEVDHLAHQAATSPENALAEPSDAQKEAGNYQKGHLKVGGFDISIENPAGSKRRPEWPTLKSHYGYIRKSEGADGDHVDVFVKPGTPSDFPGPVFVVDQVKGNGHFDEHKVVIGVNTIAEARALYSENYSKGFRVGPVTQMTQDQFRAWVHDPALSKRPVKSISTGEWKRILADQSTTTEEPVAAKAEAKPLADYGEKIGGARKDRWRDRGLNASDLTEMSGGEQAQYATKDNVWPKIDYAKMIADGAAPEAAARLKVLRDRLAAKPRQDTAAGRRDYVEVMGIVRDLAAKVKTGEDVQAIGLELRKRLGLPEQGLGLGERAQYRAQLDKLFSVYKSRTSPFAAGWSDARRVREMLAEGWPAPKAREQAEKGEGPKLPERPHLDNIERTGEEVRAGRDVSSKEFTDTFGFRGIEFGNWAANDERQRILNMAFDALHDLAGVLGIPPKAISLNGTLGLALAARGGGNFAAHYEPGKLVINMTKLRGAGSLAHEWGHALDHYFGELDQPNAYQGRARGASGWYDTRVDVRDEKRLPNLRPEMVEAFNGVLSALFQKSKTKAELVRAAELQIENTQARLDQVPDGSQRKDALQRSLAAQREALEEMKRTMAEGARAATGQSSDYKREAVRLSGKAGEAGYWARPTEMFARAFESYVFDKIHADDRVSDYLVHGVEPERYATGYKGNPYPAGAERERINEAFDKLFETAKTRETEKGVAMYAQAEGEPAGLPVATVSEWLKPAIAKLRLPARVVQSVEDLPAGAPSDTVGYYDNGTIWLVADKLRDRADAEGRLLHEIVHAGADARRGQEPVLGGFDRALRDLVVKNPEVGKRIASWRLREGRNFVQTLTERGVSAERAEQLLNVRAMEEGLAYYSEGSKPFNGWRQFVAHVQAILRSMKLNWLADKVEGWTHAETAAFIADLRSAVEEAFLPGTSAQPAFAKETAASPSERREALLSMEPIVIDDRGIGAAPTMKDAIALTREEYRKLAPVRTQDGRTVQFSRSGFNETRQHAAGRLSLRVMPQLDRLFERAVPLWSRERVKEATGDNVKAFHNYGAKAELGGRDYYVKLVVREMANGDFYYDNDLTAVEGIGDGGGPALRPAKSGALATTTSTDENSLRAWLEGVNIPPPAARTRQSEPLEFPGTKPANPGTKSVQSATKAPPGGAKPPSSGTPAAAAPNTWAGPVSSRMDNVVHALQDKHVDTKRVQRAIEEATGAKIADAADPYLQEELYHGRVAKATTDFLETELKPLVQEMAKNKVPIADFEEWLHARHAAERNAQIAKVNPQLPDGGSGMTNADARKVLAAAQSAGKTAVYQALAAKVDAITARTRAEMVRYGLEAPSTVAGWQQAYKSYVPLQREDMESGGLGTGQGFSVRGNATKRATGSTRPVVDILANVALQRERILARGEKARVGRALLGLAEANPNPTFWKVDQPPMITRVDERTGLVTHQVDPLYKSRDNVVTVPVPDGAGNVVDRAIVFNEHDERALRMARAMKNLDIDDLGAVLGTVGKFTRWFAAMNTQWNPVFGVVNLTRDAQSAMLNLSTTPIAGKQLEVTGHALSAMRGIYSDLRAMRAGKPATSAWAQLWEEFQNEGGRTGYRDVFRTSAERAQELERELTKGKAREKVEAVLGWLSDYNDTMENAFRLAAYKTAIDAGISKQRAASIAKNLTVNFNRKGAKTTQAAALWAFFNANVQGTARTWETLKGPTGTRIILGGLLVGVAQAAALAAAGLDDDEPPDWVKQKALVIPIGGKKYLTVPMAQGFLVLPNIGRLATEFAMSGFKGAAKKAAEFMEVMLDASLPVGASKTVLQTIAPTVIDPIAALSENKDWTGKPIAREDFNRLHPTPGYTRAKNTASEFSKVVSKAINTMSGGTAYKPGIFSPTPDQLDFLIGQLTGGVGREAMKLEQAGASLVTGEKLPPHKVPLVGRFYGDAAEQTSQGTRFYQNLEELGAHRAELAGRAKAGEPIGTYLRENPEAKLVGAATAAERQVAQLRRRRQTLLDKGAPKEQVQAIEDAIARRMTTFNDTVKAAKATSP